MSGLGVGAWDLGLGAWRMRFGAGSLGRWGLGLGLRGLDFEYFTVALRCMENIIFLEFDVFVFEECTYQ